MKVYEYSRWCVVWAHLQSAQGSCIIFLRSWQCWSSIQRILFIRINVLREPILCFRRVIWLVIFVIVVIFRFRYRYHWLHPSLMSRDLWVESMNGWPQFNMNMKSRIVLPSHVSLIIPKPLASDIILTWLEDVAALILDEMFRWEGARNVILIIWLLFPEDIRNISRLIVVKLRWRWYISSSFC